MELHLSGNDLERNPHEVLPRPSKQKNSPVPCSIHLWSLKNCSPSRIIELNTEGPTQDDALRIPRPSHSGDLAILAKDAGQCVDCVSWELFELELAIHLETSDKTEDETQLLHLLQQELMKKRNISQTRKD